MPAKKKAAGKSTAAKKTAAKKPTASKKPTTVKAAAKKAPAKKAASRTTVTKTTAKKAPATKKAARKPKALAAANGTAAENLGFTPYQPKKGEEYMGEPMKQHFREILRAWKRELMEEVDRTVHHMQDEAANFPDPNDRATQESEFSLELRTRDRERKLIKKIDESIGDIDADEYGFCETCGVEIGVRRLEARPTASQCIDCKTLDEIREKQMMT
ncbi:MAG TPA: RNA polymerase-binding protein DksA [Gammaproteobacteria bacterium]